MKSTLELFALTAYLRGAQRNPQWDYTERFVELVLCASFHGRSKAQYCFCNRDRVGSEFYYLPTKNRCGRRKSRDRRKNYLLNLTHRRVSCNGSLLRVDHTLVYVGESLSVLSFNRSLKAIYCLKAPFFYVIFMEWKMVKIMSIPRSKGWRLTMLGRKPQLLGWEVDKTYNILYNVDIERKANGAFHRNKKLF